MKFYLTVLVIFGIVVAGAMNLPQLTQWLRKRDIETTAKDHILARLKDPASVKWNHKRVTPRGGVTLLTYDFTGTAKDGATIREIWTFEFDTSTKDLLSVKQTAVPGLKFGEILPDKGAPAP